MSDKKVQKNSIGTKIIVDTEVVLTAVTAQRILWKQPNTYDEDGDILTVGASGSWVAVIDGTTIYYITTSANDLPVAGAWCIQSDIESPAWSGRGKSTQLIVMENC